VSEKENEPADSDQTDDEREASGQEADAPQTLDQAIAPGEEESLDPVASLKIELEQSLNDLSAAREDVLRARAEADNTRKRAERDVVAAHKFGLERFIGELLPVKDSMDLGFNALDATIDADTVREGMALTRKMFDDALEKGGVTPVEPVGEAFDPDFHQAITMEPAEDVAAGTVLRVVQKGYVLNGRLIRPAMVIVAKAVDDGQAQERST